MPVHGLKDVFDLDFEQGGRTNVVVHRHRSYHPRSRPPLVPSQTVPAVDLICAGR
jgi:hypothetical protein